MKLAHVKRFRRFRRFRATLPAMLAIVSFLVVGCGGDDGGGGAPEPTAAELASEGWTSFEAGDYEEAKRSFSAAIDKDDTLADAHTGLGFSLLNQDSLSAAKSRFQEALTRDSTSADSYAGLAVICPESAPPDFQGAVDAALAALDIDGSYQFAHDTELNSLDLHLILAQSYFNLLEYDLANAQVGELGGTEADPQSSSYVEDLAAAIQALEQSISS